MCMHFVGVVSLPGAILCVTSRRDTQVKHSEKYSQCCCTVYCIVTCFGDYKKTSSGIYKIRAQTMQVCGIIVVEIKILQSCCVENRRKNIDRKIMLYIYIYLFIYLLIH